MDVTVNDEKMKKKGKEAKKIKATKETNVKKGEQTEERSLKSDGTYTHRPFELFFKKRKEEKESKK